MSATGFNHIVPLIERNDPIINSLNMSYIDITDGMVDSLIRAVSGNIFLRRITLQRNSLSESSCKKIFEMLLTNSEITHLEICKNSVSDNSLCYLSEVLMQLPKSRQNLTLILRSNSFGHRGAGALAGALAKNVPVEWLDMRYNKSVGDQGIAEIGAALRTNKNLKGLDVIECGCSTNAIDALSDSLLENDTLTSLVIEDPLNRDAIYYLSHLLGDDGCHLRTLYLWKCALNAELMRLLCKSMRKNTSLQTLGLSYNNMDDSVAIYVADMLYRNKCLVKVYLGANDFTPLTGGMIGVAIMNNKTVELLDLSRNRLKSAGFWPLAEALSETKVLTTLDLRHNQIDSSASEMICQLVSSINSIRVLRLSGNNLGDMTVVPLASQLATNKSLKEIELNDVGMSTGGFSALCRALESNETLEKISVGQSQLAADALERFAQLLTVNKTLVTICMPRCQIPDDGMKWIGQGLMNNATLRTLDISNNGITRKGMKMLIDAMYGNYTLLYLEWQGSPLDEDPSAKQLTDTLFDCLQRNRYYEHNLLMKDLSSILEDM